MSLFPAYMPSTSKINETEAISECLQTENITLNSDQAWLNNTSFNIAGDDSKGGNTNEQVEQVNWTETRSLQHKMKKKRRKLKAKDKLTKWENKTTAHESSVIPKRQFWEDKIQEKGNFLVNTLYYPAIPRYDKNNYHFKKYKKKKYEYRKKGKCKRYFMTSTENITTEFDNELMTKEEILKNATQDFNKKVNDNPCNIELWLEYIQFQDLVYQFEKAYRNNKVGAERVTLERKLAILKQALEYNPASTELLKEKLNLIELMQPVDQLIKEYDDALMKDPSNLILWQAMIRAISSSMARCTVPGVLQTFSKAISKIRQHRIHETATSVDKDILTLILECGLFLQQAGLWEQLWTLLKMYLSLSLTTSGQFEVPAQITEIKLKQLEDTVVCSGLPLSVLWLRIEKLRASLHFFPDDNCESDPQRVVFSSDMRGLLQPLKSSDLNMHLVIIVLVLLKIPLLPTRHSLLQCLGIIDIPSATNNVETLLAVIYHSGIAVPNDCNYFSGAIDLICEPQYVRHDEGQTHFFIWVVQVMTSCAELLPFSDSIIIHTWLLRLYGLLCRLHILGHGDVPSSVITQAKSHARQLLKKAQFRDNMLLYAEYALIERNAGDIDKSCKVLETVMLKPLPSTSEHDVNYICFCRRLVECLIVKNSIIETSQIMRIMLAITNHQQMTTVPVNEVNVHQNLVKWNQHTAELLQYYIPLADQPLTVAMAMKPHFIVEWIAVHALFLTVTHSVWETLTFLQQHIKLIPHTPNTLGNLWVEQIYEILVDILYRHTIHSKTSFSVLRSTLDKAMKYFPNNMSLLNTLAIIETQNNGGGTPLWKLVHIFPSFNPIARLVLLLVVRYRVALNLTDALSSTIGTNYLKNLLEQLLNEKTTRQCPLMHRFHLQFIGATANASQIKAVFYRSLQVCPWAKALYLDAVKFLPEELAEIQDLLIEKELRLHTTPEELDILRA